jgi:hypothetical protein
MSEKLQEAAERTRLERRRTLMHEVSPFLEPGEDVVEVTGGRVAAEGSPEHGVAVRVAATDRRLLVLRKRAFRQFAVDEFGYGASAVWLGYTVETGGLLELEDPTKHMRIGSVPELDLEPFFVACSGAMAADRVNISLEVGGSSRAGDSASGGASRQEPVGGSEPVDRITVLEDPSADAPEEPATGAVATVGAPFEMSDLPPDRPRPPEHVVTQAQSAILRWLVAETGARAGVCLGRSPGGEERLLVEPRRLDSETVLELVRRAREQAPGESAGDTLSVLAMRWAGPGGSKALLLSGPTEEFGLERLRFAQFVIEWLDAPARSTDAPSIAAPWPGGEGPQTAEPAIVVDLGEAAAAAAAGREEPGLAPADQASQAGHRENRPRLMEVTVNEDAEGRPGAEARVAWRGRELVGRGFGHTSTVGRHLAIARAAVDAIQPLIRGDVLIEHLFLTYPPLDAELVVLVVLVGEERYIGATAAVGGREDWGAAMAVLDALNRRLPHLTGPGGTGS